MALVVVNNWNVLATGYCDLYGPWIYAFFVAFNVFAVTVAMNVMTAFYINAFQIATVHLTTMTIEELKYNTLRRLYRPLVFLGLM